MMDKRTADVLEYVRANPGCTTRDVSRFVFGGTGGVRTTERSYANIALQILLHQKRVRRELEPAKEWPSYLYTVT